MVEHLSETGPKP